MNLEGLITLWIVFWLCHVLIHLLIHLEPILEPLKVWAHGDLNPGSSPCKGDVITDLDYEPRNLPC